ncbi:MAG: fumarylacetoacetate hydrolase family protein [Myxococcota bacterium]
MINVAPWPTVPVLGEKEPFPVRRIFCVAKNYAAHTREMGDDPSRVPPTFFDKPVSALSVVERLPYPRETTNLHHEVELVLAVGAATEGPVEPENASKVVFAAGCGVDLTRRDLQARAKSAGGPWDLAKGFRGSAPVGALRTLDTLPDAGSIRLWVNDEIRQDSDLDHMIWDCSEIVAQLTRYEDLEPGDLIFTGTPAGVGPLVQGDQVRAEIEGIGTLAFTLQAIS